MSNIKDVKAKSIPITLCDGVERELKFTLNALAELEDHYGTVDAAFKALDGGSFKAIRFVLWAGLVHADSALTEKQVGALIDVQSMPEIIEQLGNALDNDLPKDSEGTNPN